LRKLAPLALLYAAIKGLHRRIGLRPALKNRDSLLPLIVIGGLRAGGSGKTSVTLELARQLSAQGRRVGILAYRIHKSPKNHCAGIQYLSDDVAEVTSEADWRSCSDEAVLLARTSGARVFATRNRERAWDLLSPLGEFDVLISDDGLMDPRLQKSFRVVLKRPGEFPGVFDLLPAGPYRMTAGILNKVDCVVEGPLSDTQTSVLSFRRKLIFPEGFDRHFKYHILCGLGNPEAFREDLLRAGVAVSGISRGPDHGLPNLRQACIKAAKEQAAGFICTAKDWIKLQDRTTDLGAEWGTVTVVNEQIELDANLISTLKKHLESRPSS
jgi:tetraacyldisaccharide 4'-kinase